MAQQTIGIGAAPNDGTGDPIRDAFDKCNDNFTELYTGLTGLLDFKGSTDCSANPNYPAASKGDFYLVSVAGKIGGASGIVVEVGDSYFATADNAGGTQAGVGSSWTVIQGNIISYYSPGGTDVAVADGGTGASSASAARTNLGLVIGTDVLGMGGGTLTGDLSVPDEAYDATNWNGSLEVPTKNAVRDKIESLGSSYTAENARDDIGAALVAGAGVKITVNDPSDTITLAANCYEAGPPGTVPNVASLTWVNQGSASASDGTRALLFDAQCDGNNHFLKTSTPATPFDIYCKADSISLSTAGDTTFMDAQTGIILRDGTNGDLLTIYMLQRRISGDEQQEYGTGIDYFTATNTYSTTPIYRVGGCPYKWLRVNVTSTTITMYVSTDGINWLQVGTETIATRIGAVTEYGLFHKADANNTTSRAIFSYFSTTAPA